MKAGIECWGPIRRGGLTRGCEKGARLLLRWCLGELDQHGVHLLKEGLASH